VQLFGAIVRIAIIEAIRGRIGGEMPHPYTRANAARSAREWFDSPAFVNLCHLFNAEPDAVREASLHTIKLNQHTRSRQVNWQA